MSKIMRSKELVLVSKNLNGKGKLKGKNKKETKALRGICPHHKVTKKGKIRAQFFVGGTNAEGQQMLYCKMCGQSFRAPFFDNDEINEIVDRMRELNNQNKFTSVATNAGQKTVSYFATMGSMLQTYPKLAKKLRNVAEKSGKMKKRKREQEYGSAKYGSWASR